jgi:hypothetical protein
MATKAELQVEVTRLMAVVEQLREDVAQFSHGEDNFISEIMALNAQLAEKSEMVVVAPTASRKQLMAAAKAHAMTTGRCVRV